MEDEKKGHRFVRSLSVTESLYDGSGCGCSIMIQNGITNFVKFADNIMIGRIGTSRCRGLPL